MEYKHSDLCAVFLCVLCGKTFLTAENAKIYAELRRDDTQKGLAELKEFV
jgi:hypothetical protein